MIPIAYVLAFVVNIGVVGIMIAVVIGIIVCAVAIFVRFRYTMNRIIRDNNYLY